MFRKYKNTVMVLQNFSKFARIHVTKWHQEKNKYVAIACHFLRFIWRKQKRTQLRNRYLKKRSYQNKRHYTKKRSFWISLLRKATKEALC